MKKFQTREAAGAFVDTLSVINLRELTIDLLLEREAVIQPKKLPLTREQFEAHFRILGENGETRGRPKKTE